ncbi:MAG: phage Gp37/Gp68 family protein [Sandaracinaceae bacterium]
MSKIQWTDETWNPTIGCSIISDGCANCYAMRDAYRKQFNPNEKVASAYAGLTRKTGKGRLIWTGKVNQVPDRLDAPLRWRKPRLVFVNSMSDLFHESVPFEYIAAVFGVMAAAPQHTFQVLTKRPERAREFFAWLDRDSGFVPNILGGLQVAMGSYTNGSPFGRTERWHQAVEGVMGADWPLPNVWLGVSVEDPPTAERRISELLRLPAAVRWVSYEPALAGVDFSPWLGLHHDACTCDDCFGAAPGGLDWIVIGGESGHGARPFDLAWARQTIEQAREAGVPVFVKQLGARPTVTLTSRLPGCLDDADALDAITDRKGGDPSEWPEDLRVREWPRGRA